jgi:hypothetical protein
MPWYPLLCKICNVEFEDFFSAHAPVPTLCTNPECQADGYIQRLIPDVVHGRVPLTGSDLKKSITKERNQMRDKINKDENLKANIVGESAYENHVVAQQKLKDTYK